MEERFIAIIEDRDHGSRWLVSQTIQMLYDLASDDRLGTDERLHWLWHYGRRFLNARPAMAALTSAVVRILCAEGGLPGIAAEAKRLQEQYIQAPARIREYAQPLIRGRVLTCSLSGTVVDVLAAQRAQLEHVFVLEGRPRYEGRTMARELVKHGLAVTLLTDAQADIFLPICQSVVVGADSILINGDLLNKAGTALLAWAARGHDIPFYVLCETLKISSRRWQAYDPAHWQANLSLLEEKEPEEVWNHSDIQSDGQAFTIRNFYFDHTPHRLITHIITEDGLLDRRTIRERAVQIRGYERQFARITRSHPV